MVMTDDMYIEAEDEIRCMIGAALYDHGFSADDAEHIADTCDIPWEWLLKATVDKHTALVDWACDSFKEP